MAKITALIELLNKIQKELGKDLDVVVSHGQLMHSITTANTIQVNNKVNDWTYKESKKGKKLVIELA